MFNPFQFIRETRSELAKVVWPSRQEILKITIAVIIMSLAVALFLGAVDFGLTKLLEFSIVK